MKARYAIVQIDVLLHTDDGRAQSLGQALRNATRRPSHLFVLRGRTFNRAFYQFCHFERANDRGSSEGKQRPHGSNGTAQYRL